MDYLFYSLYRFFYIISKGRSLFRTPEESALSIIALDSASIALALIYLLVNREFEGYGIWSMMWFLGACIIYFLLVRFYDCEKKIRKISQKSKYSKCISHILSAFITLFAIWLWIFYGLKFIYSIINASCLEIP